MLLAGLFLLALAGGGEAATTCAADEWEAQPLTADADRVCKAHTRCKPEEWESKPAGTHHDRECRMCDTEASSGNTNCWQGNTGDTWSSGARHWSMQTLPSYADWAVVHKHAVTVSTRVRGAAEEVIADADIVVDGDGELEVGPRHCYDVKTADAVEFETIAPVTKAATQSGKADRTCQVATTCAPNEWETSPLTASSDRKCQTLTTCSGIEWETRAPGPRHDRECRAHTVCAGDEFETKAAGSHNDRVCETHTVCARTHWESKPAGTHHDRVCTALTTCHSKQWETKSYTATSDRVCAHHTVCGTRQWETKAAGTHHDRECAEHTKCTGSEWETKEAGPHHDRECTAHTVCAGADIEYESTKPGTHHDRECTACAPCEARKARIGCGKPSAPDFAGTCEWVCSGSSSVAATAEPVNCWQGGSGVWMEDRLKWSRKTFPAFPEWVVVAHRGTLQSPEEVLEVSTRVRAAAEEVIADADVVIDIVDEAELEVGARHCDTSEYEGAPPTRAQDRVCLPRVVCSAVQWLPPQTQTASRVCADHTVCSAEQWETRAPGTHHDRECAEHTRCSVTQWETKAASASSDRECADHRACTTAEWMLKAAGTHHDRECSPVTVCDPQTQYEIVAPTATSDRVCGMLATCDLDTQYESTPPTFSADRVCTALTTCTATQWLSRRKTPTRDRVCTEHTTCNASGADATQWVSKEAGALHDRECTELTTCAAGMEVKVAPSRYADRVCAPCGQYAHKAQASNSPCAPCPAGFRARADRKACKAYQCSHMTCGHEHRACYQRFKLHRITWAPAPGSKSAKRVPTHHTVPNGPHCDHAGRHNSTRVHHHNAEKVCQGGFRCGHVKRGGHLACVCRPVLAVPDFAASPP